MVVLDISSIIVEIRKIKEDRRIENGGPKQWSSSNKFEVLMSRMMEITT